MWAAVVEWRDTKVCIRQRRKTRSCVHRVIDVARIVSSLCSTWCGTLNILTQFQTTNHLKITIYHKWLVCILNNGKFKNWMELPPLDSLSSDSSLLTDLLTLRSMTRSCELPL
jgi:hypothetical protein